VLCQEVSPKIRKAFRFENFWPRMPGYIEVVKEAWQGSTLGCSPLNVLYYKLQRTAKALKSWSSKLFSKARLELAMANEVIQRLDVAQENRQLSAQELQLRSELKARVLGLAAIERSRRRQASRLLWLKEGDACTRFFHLKANGCSRKNYVPCLKRADGSYAWTQEEKQSAFQQHFQSVLGSRIPRLATLNWEELSLPQLVNHHLDAPFSEEEVKAAIDDLPAEKAPGPDGFTGVFYRSSWDVIKHDLPAALQCVYNLTAGPLPWLNGALLTLLPKKVASELPGDFRLISLIHSFAKLISKVLAQRLAPHIDSLVSNAQSAFIKYRCIQDNFLSVRNLARAYHRKKVPALLLKMDISRAFDSVSWEYLLELLQRRGFPARWRNWLALLLSSSSSSVRLNGVRGPWIKHQRGLRQGNPLSPYLFILVIDTLQFILQRATTEGLITPLRDRMSRLRLSLYADDDVVFLNPVKADVDMLKAIMEWFGDANGLKINVSKSTVAPIRCSQVDLDEILQNFGGPRVSLPISYLGLPITLGRLKMVNLQTVLDKAATRMNGWQGKLLNLGGRRELVKTVLSSLPVYLLTAIKAPKRFFKELDKLRRRFLWSGNQDLHGGQCKVNWARVCRPLHCGGLGIMDLECLSRALRIRWLWFQWKTLEKPWCQSELPVDDTDCALFAAAT
jgi:hypothetical protein